MPVNPYIDRAIPNTQSLYEDLLIEAIQFYGKETYYIPRKIIKENQILNHIDWSKFDEAYELEMYPESIDGYEGDGNLLSTFGLQVKHQMTLSLSRRRFSDVVGDNTGQIRPNEGDLLYIPFCKGLFEIQYVNGDSPFFQLNNMPAWKLTCELFQYNNEEMDTDIEEIDMFETTHTSRTRLYVTHHSGTLLPNEELYQTVEYDKLEGLNLDENGEGFLSLQELHTPLSTVKDTTEVTGTILQITNDYIDVNRVYSLNNDHTFAITGGNNSYLIGRTSGALYFINEVTDPKEDFERATKNDTLQIAANEFLDISEKNPFGNP